MSVDEMGQEKLHEFFREIKLTSALVHKKIVKFIGISVPDDTDGIYLITVRIL